jgi:hypothetical protein
MGYQLPIRASLNGWQTIFSGGGWDSNPGPWTLYILCIVIPTELSSRGQVADYLVPG